jgi:pimeloyl-ACP methyl ester carboxylesterase
VDIDGPVRYLDFGGPADGPVIVCVHGLGGSAVNWTAVAPLLTGTCRVLAPDLAGHGLTQSLGRATDVASNRALLHRFVMSVTGGPVILMGNSMGGMISLLEASAAPSDVSRLILIDPALPWALARPDPVVAALFTVYAMPGVGHVMLNWRRDAPPEATVARVMSICCADPSGLPADIVDRHVEVERRRAEFGEDGQAFTGAMRSVVGTVTRARGRPYRAAAASVSCPVLVLSAKVITEWLAQR